MALCIFTFLHNSSEGMFFVYLRNCIFCPLSLSVIFIVWGIHTEKCCLSSNKNMLMRDQTQFNDGKMTCWLGFLLDFYLHRAFPKHDVDCQVLLHILTEWKVLQKGRRLTSMEEYTIRNCLIEIFGKIKYNCTVQGNITTQLLFATSYKASSH